MVGSRDERTYQSINDGGMFRSSTNVGNAIVIKPEVMLLIRLTEDTQKMINAAWLVDNLRIGGLAISSIVSDIPSSDILMLEP